MREIHLDGYIDDEEFFGDEITPTILQQQLYGTSGGEPDDIRITLNSYGGSCNAATRMFDMLFDYPAKVSITISGTAASAATVLAMAADELTMTPGSLYMIHDPATMAWGNERAMDEAKQLLHACKDSILNVYALRCTIPRDEIAAMMTKTTWMDAEEALAHGFIDQIAQSVKATNTAKTRIVNRRQAEAKVAAYFDRQHIHPIRENSTPTPALEQKSSGVPIEQLHRRLDLIKN